MDVRGRDSLLPCLKFLVSLVVVLSLPLFVHSQCKRNPVIFNFGDSNSDTGGYAAAHGFIYLEPEGRTFFHQPANRWCDGRLIIDFLCENLTINYLTPYMESLGTNFTNGANFAVSGSGVLPKFVPFSLDVQVKQFIRFKNRSLELTSKGVNHMVGDEEFKSALYTIDIGQNDISRAFDQLSYAQVIEKIPSFISEIEDAIKSLYRQGGRNFWIHGPGPLGCFPEELTRRGNGGGDFDKYGCLQSLNECAKAFNEKLSGLCEELRSTLENTTVVYVDMFAIKHGVFVNAAAYGFENPLMACCGYGGPPYNYDPIIKCSLPGCPVCDKVSQHISWDGIHYTEAANKIFASKLLSTNYSTPPFKFNYFCN